jgi:glyoxylase-like metal-dependent hydrolase (beta-lactamase superfamily II)
MGRTARVALAAAAALVAAAVAAAWWLTAREAVPARSDFPLDLVALRRLADAEPGPKPLRVNAELVAESALPGAAVFAGESFAPHRKVHQVLQVVWADRFGVVDAAFGPAQHAEMGGEGHPYDEEAFARVQEALVRAEWVVVTHEHGDHIGGVARHPEPEALAERLRLTRAQRDSEERLDEVAFPERLRAVEPFDVEGARALAPGVVLVAAPGHTPGSQLVYVRLADGAELLFVGDVAWHGRALRELHYRPRFVTLLLGEDRAAVLAQYRALHELMAAHPEVAVVVSHDAEQRAALLGAERLGERIELTESSAP